MRSVRREQKDKLICSGFHSTGRHTHQKRMPSSTSPLSPEDPPMLSWAWEYQCSQELHLGGLSEVPRVLSAHYSRKRPCEKSTDLQMRRLNPGQQSPTQECEPDSNTAQPCSAASRSLRHWQRQTVAPPTTKPPLQEGQEMGWKAKNAG